MQTVLASQLKKGMVILLDGVPHTVENLQSVGTAQTRPKIHLTLRNLKTGRLVERASAVSESFSIPYLETRKLQFSYKQADRYVFLDVETYDEWTLDEGQIGDRRPFILEDQVYDALFMEGRLLEIQVPDTMVLTVEETAPPIRGASDATWKPARLQGGLDIMVPPFIRTGEKIRVDTRKREYVGKASKE
ncbi:elongation factor P [Candidatus Methylacidithermus pantelleriae]|uniref:Translation elongation factor P / Translation initiation factor 5A n=1 Tax=Candidatus Methylacidithermus pantelleriae TaxID=2744239 RepID=A0A8J2BWP3_9BACT|nr:hypothetical protein [Candidatus Methylacidithermus pantelleriae]CAF0705086.1 Translation elongation factor P / Translation initiation factor 5A [Candidatus Methylacidithermus pantelleriae]